MFSGDDYPSLSSEHHRSTFIGFYCGDTIVFACCLFDFDLDVRV